MQVLLISTMCELSTGEPFPRPGYQLPRKHLLKRLHGERVYPAGRLAHLLLVCLLARCATWL